MNSKIKIKKDKRTGKTQIDYYKTRDKRDFRYQTYQSLCKDKKTLVIINTNYGCTEPTDNHKDHIKILERMLNNYKYQYVVTPIQYTSNKKIFGFAPIKDDNKSAYKLAFILPENGISEDVFNNLFCLYDIEMGIELKVDEKQIFEDFSKGYIESSFDKEYFTNGFFDAILFEHMNTDIQIDESTHV